MLTYDTSYVMDDFMVRVQSGVLCFVSDNFVVYCDGNVDNGWYVTESLRRALGFHRQGKTLHKLGLAHYAEKHLRINPLESDLWAHDVGLEFDRIGSSVFEPILRLEGAARTNAWAQLATRINRRLVTF